MLELVRTLQSSFAIAHRLEGWLVLLQHARTAAEGLADRGAEVWVLDELAAASAALGDGAAAERYAREAEALRRRLPGADGARSTARRARPGRAVVEAALRPVVVALGVIAAGLVGLAAGLAVERSGGGATVTTEVPVTVTAGGATVTTAQTVTLPAETVTTPGETVTTVSTTTETLTTTQTVTTVVVG